MHKLSGKDFFNKKEMHLIDNYLEESAMISIMYSSRGRGEITLVGVGYFSDILWYSIFAYV